ncbi:MAG: DNA metabolism protein [Verrucomicrobia bacterium]|nr:DNA metabolism protein [Verrucomicrobiota bacterium]
MHTAHIKPTLESWREEARTLLARGVPPDAVLWCQAGDEPSLFQAESFPSPAVDSPAPRVPAAFMDLARTLAAHADERRWGLLYRLLWRITHGGERALLSVPTDADVRLVEQWRKSVSREIHKMHAFVRFRLTGRDEATGREQFVAWFEPEHRIVRLAAPFFERRFAGMDWSILTPEECAHWDGERLHFTPGVPRSAAPSEDALEKLWRTYFKSIFNPARLKVKMMQQEMPKKYWKNLPEAPLIPELIAESGDRVRNMLATEELEVKPAPQNAYLESLRRKDNPEL